MANDEILVVTEDTIDLPLGEATVIQAEYTGGDTASVEVVVNNTTKVITANVKAIVYNSLADFPETGNNAQIYVDKSDNKTYYWNGTEYVNCGGGSGDDLGSRLSVERLNAFLYKATFDTIPEYKALENTIPAGCTSFVRDGKLYRNLDWNYDNTAEFEVVTKNFRGMAFISGLNDGSLDARISQLPYHLVDGVNNDGIMVSTHILYNDWQYAGSGNKNVPLTTIVFHILNELHSINNISTVLTPYLNNIEIPQGLINLGYLAQFLVTDGTTTYAILPPTSANGNWEIVNISALPKLTNFRWLNKATIQRNDADLQSRPTGIERWNLIGADTTLEDLRFTLAYESPNRLSEFIGIDDTTKESTDAELTDIYNRARAIYLDRQRDGRTWQTVHSVVYDGTEIAELYAQENYDISYAINVNDFAKTADITRIDGEITSVKGRVSTNETNIAGLDTRVGTAESDITTLQGRMNTAENDIDTAEANIETLSTGLATAEQDIQELNNDVDAIEAVIPNVASAQNQLADKAFVNSTVQTATSAFRGNWLNWASVPTDASEYPKPEGSTDVPTNNDYMVVGDASGYVDPQQVLSGAWRFKYNGVWATDGRNGWYPEYQVNREPLTQAQLNALNSGITAGLVQKITDNENAINTLDTNKQDLITSQDKLDADLVDDTNSTNKFVTTTEKNTWNGKQNALSTTQLSAVDSGIDSTKVAQIATNTTDITNIKNQYLKNASVSDNTLTITKQDDTTIQFQGGSDIDNTTISKNSDGELQAIGLTDGSDGLTFEEIRQALTIRRHS